MPPLTTEHFIVTFPACSIAPQKLCSPCVYSEAKMRGKKARRRRGGEKRQKGESVVRARTHPCFSARTV